MDNTNTPVFSSFRRLRQTHPDLYYQVDTYRKMLIAQKKLGAAFYDLMSEGQNDERS